MTDKEKIITFLTEFGIGFDESKHYIACCEGMPKVSGYSGFYVSFMFDDDGSFLEVGAYE